MISISNSTNNMAARKYLTEKGSLALPIESKPHSKLCNFWVPLRFGPSKWVNKNVPPTNPTTKINWTKMEK